jgi:hypothetical protein
MLSNFASSSSDKNTALADEEKDNSFFAMARRSMPR